MSDEVKKIDKGGQRLGTKRNQKTRDAIAAGQVFRIVREAATGQREVTATQLKAAELFLKKTMPDLSSVEQKIINDDDAKPIEQIQDELILMLKANPDLLAIINDKLTDKSLNESLH